MAGVGAAGGGGFSEGGERQRQEGGKGRAEGKASQVESTGRALGQVQGWCAPRKVAAADSAEEAAGRSCRASQIFSTEEPFPPQPIKRNKN